jgi:hypothetical protein
MNRRLMTKLVLIMGFLMVINALVLVTTFRHEPGEAASESSAANETKDDAKDEAMAKAEERLPAAASHSKRATDEADEIAKRRAQRREANAPAASPAAEEKAEAKSVPPQDPDYKTPFFTGYRPPLMGECKKLFRKFKSDPIESGQFKSFAYSYDGSFAACASTVSEQHQQAADRVAIEECESNRRSPLESARCRIYAIE